VTSPKIFVSKTPEKNNQQAVQPAVEVINQSINQIKIYIAPHQDPYSEALT